MIPQIGFKSRGDVYDPISKGVAFYTRQSDVHSHNPSDEEVAGSQEILGRLRSTIKKPATWEDSGEDSAKGKRGSKVPVVATSILQSAQVQAT